MITPFDPRLVCCNWRFHGKVQAVLDDKTRGFARTIGSDAEYWVIAIEGYWS
jgi:hypothetical protein